MRKLVLMYILFIPLLSIAENIGHITELPLEEESANTFHSKSWHLGMGNYFDLPSNYQVSSAGAKNSFSFWPILNWGRTYQGYFYSNFLFQWNLLLSLPKDVGTSDLTRTLLAFDFLVGHKVSYVGAIYLGLSFFQQFLIYKDTGETQTEGNGTGGRFYRPSRTVMVSQQALVAAYSTPRFFDHFLVEAKTYIFSLWESEKSQSSYAVNLSYQW